MTRIFSRSEREAQPSSESAKISVGTTALHRCLLFLLFVAAFFPWFAQRCEAETRLLPEIGSSWSARLVSVIDGDSLLVSREGQEVHLRLYGIDAPEFNQPGAGLARRHLKLLVSGRPLSVTVMDIDRYGRAVAQVRTDRTHVNEELIRVGAAWVYPRYCTTAGCQRWKELQQQARTQRIGLWRQQRPISPWQWKRNR